MDITCPEKGKVPTIFSQASFAVQSLSMPVSYQCPCPCLRRLKFASDSKVSLT